jgi:hypothetical protein
MSSNNNFPGGNKRAVLAVLVMAIVLTCAFFLFRQSEDPNGTLLRNSLLWIFTIHHKNPFAFWQKGF